MVNKKKETRVAKTYRLYQKYVKEGAKSADTIKKLGKEMKLSESVIRGYIWRAKNPTKFKAIVKKYFEKKRAKKKAAIETEMAVVAPPIEEEIKETKDV